MTRVFLALFLSAIAGADAASGEPQLSQPMRFSLFKPCREFSPQCEWRVLAQGDIQLDSAVALEASLHQWARQGVTAPWVCFDSLGGSLGGALAMGTLIRSRGLDTCMARRYADVAESQAQSIQISDDAICASACAYVLAGGVNRRFASDAVVAVHQFHSTGPDASQDTTQRVMTEVGLYLDEMGVKRALLDRATQSSPAEIEILSDAQILKFDLKTEDLTASGTASNPYQYQRDPSAQDAGNSPVAQVLPPPALASRL
jgi:hypothetical protein